LPVGSGFAIGAIIYSVFSRYLEQNGAAVRYPTRFREFIQKRREHDAKELIELLSRCDLLRHLPPQEIEIILPSVRTRPLAAGQVLFNAGDPGDILYIVARGEIEILEANGSNGVPPDQPIASLREGEAFGEMALLSDSPRTATARSAGDVELLEIDRKDFERLVAEDQVLARAVEQLSHDWALNNLSAGTPGAASWAAIASSSLERVTQREANRLLTEGGHGSGIPIILGNVLDTIPGCLVIGSTFHGFGTLSLTLMLGMFIGGIPEAAASAATLRRAGFRPAAIFDLWSTVLVAGTFGSGRRQRVHRRLVPAPHHIFRSRSRRRRARSGDPRHDPRGDLGGRFADRPANHGRLPHRPVPGTHRIFRPTMTARGRDT
jgi:CRP-like cAMP-binding protein